MKEKTATILVWLYLLVYPFVSYFITSSTLTVVHGKYTKANRGANVIKSVVPGINVLTNCVDIVVLISATQGNEEATW